MNFTQVRIGTRILVIVLTLCGCAPKWRPAPPQISTQSRQIVFTVPKGWMQRPQDFPVILMKDDMDEAWMHVSEEPFLSPADFPKENINPLWKNLADWEIGRQKRIFLSNNFKVVKALEEPVSGYPGTCVEVQFTARGNTPYRRRICEFMANEIFYRFALTANEQRYLRDVRTDFDAMMSSIKRTN